MKRKHILILLALILCSQFGFAQFGPQQEITQSVSNPSCIFAVDIDGDNDLDIVTSSFDDSKITWYENIDGNGNYGEQQVVSNTSYGAKYVYASDIDGDGDNDILAGSYYDDKIVWYKNTDGIGAFDSGHLISSNADGVSFVKLWDIDGDGDNDIISASISDDKIAWYENTDGIGSFGTGQIISTNYKESINTGDIDCDGDNDIIFISNDGNTAWLENINGNFGTEQILIDTFEVNYVYTDDIDSDGYEDLIFSSMYDHSISWCKNSGSGIFEERQIIDFGSYMPIIEIPEYINSCDINNDGDIDLFVILNTNELRWYENTDGNGTFGNANLIAYTGNYSTMCAFDIDGDNDKDILTSFIDGFVWHENIDGNGTFGHRIITAPTTSNIKTAFIIDIDGDGDNDIISASSGDDKIAWYENTDGNGSFGSQKIVSINANGACSVSSCDIDGDGDNDIISASSGGNKIAWYENTDGMGIFGPQQIISTILNNPNIVISNDFDNDGDYDILFCSDEDNQVLWIRNDGYGNFDFESFMHIASFVDVKSVSSDDIDNDGDIDIVFALNFNESIIWYENNGLGEFDTSHIVISDVLDPRFVKLCDIDNDGDKDIFSLIRDSIIWFKNTDGNGTFVQEQIISNTSYCDFLYSCDIDDDGDNDLISTSDHNILMWYENIDGNGAFNTGLMIYNLSEPAGFSYSKVFASDFDGDGDNDILTTSEDECSISWFENYLYGAPYKIKGNIFYDQNQNSINDTLEQRLSFMQIELNPNELASFTNWDGEYWFATDTGNYVLSYLPIQNWSLTTDSTEYNVHLTSTEPIIDSLDFGFYPDSFFTAINPELTSSLQRCDEVIDYWINYQNLGTTKPNGVVELILDPQITYVSSDIAPDSIVGQNYYWHFDTLNFFAQEMIWLNVQLPDFNSTGDTLNSFINVYASDSTGQSVFADSLSEVLTCSYDPNDKLVTPKGEGIDGVISKDETLEYTVRFQNTGNTEAINIKIRDQIDEDINIQSIQILASSHDVQAYVEQNRWLVFQFDSIMLPDSSANFSESQGFVKYSVKLNDNVLPNAHINNTANIYFDNNPAVITNTVLNTVECYITPTAPNIYQSGTDLVANTNYGVQWYLDGTIIFGATDSTYAVTEDGTYIVEVFDDNGCSSFSEEYIVVTTDLDNFIDEGIKIYPNPSTGSVQLVMSNKQLGSRIDITDINGRIAKQLVINNKQLTIDLSHEAKGIYFVKLITEQGVSTQKLVLE